MRLALWGTVFAFCCAILFTSVVDGGDGQSGVVFTKRFPSLSDSFPWGADFRKVDRVYKGLVRTWGDMTPFERTRIEQYELEMPCCFSKKGKVRVRFRFKSHRLYEVQFKYFGKCAENPKPVLQRLQAFYGKPASVQEFDLPHGKLFKVRKVHDWIWTRNDYSINMRFRRDVFVPSVYKKVVSSLFITFRATESSVQAKEGPSGERSKVQLQKDKQVLSGGKRFEVLFLGELAPSGGMVEEGNWEGVLAGIAKRSSKADFSVASLDVPLGYDCETAAPPEFVSALLYAGIDMLFLTHSVKRCGSEVFQTTKRVLEASNIRVVEPEKGYSLFNVGNLRIAAIAFDADRFDESRIGKALEKVQAETAILAARSDVLIVGLYWDSPKTYCPTEVVRRVAETALAAGADIVWGYGNKALSGMMRFGGGVAFFGGGVLLTADKHNKDPEGIAAKALVNKHGVITYEPVAVASNPARWLFGEHAKYVISRFVLLSQTCSTSGAPRKALEPFKR